MLFKLYRTECETDDDSLFINNFTFYYYYYTLDRQYNQYTYTQKNLGNRGFKSINNIHQYIYPPEGYYDLSVGAIKVPLCSNCSFHPH